MKKIIANEITLYGTVQGVGFRYRALKAAENFDVKGYVENRPDGSVFIFAESQKENMDAFIRWCEGGASFARIERISVIKCEPKFYTNFEIRKT